MATVKDEMEKTRQMALEATNIAIEAVPGERFLRLIDDLHGDDKEARKRAQDFLMKLAKIDPESQFEATINVIYNGDTPVKLFAFQSSSADRV